MVGLIEEDHIIAVMPKSWVYRFPLQPPALFAGRLEAAG